jgi:hypothetical protein
VESFGGQWPDVNEGESEPNPSWAPTVLGSTPIPCCGIHAAVNCTFDGPMREDGSQIVDHSTIRPASTYSALSEKLFCHLVRVDDIIRLAGDRGENNITCMSNKEGTGCIMEGQSCLPYLFCHPVNVSYQ